MTKELFNELYEEFIEENGRDPEPQEIHEEYVNYCASWGDHLCDEAKYE